MQNSAGYGGGLYASGPISLQFAANMQSNRAVNGGGMYLANSIDMTFGVNEKDLKFSGLIVGNEAKGEGENDVGGGVYLAKGILRFALSDDFKDLVSITIQHHMKPQIYIQVVAKQQYICQIYPE